MRESARRVFCRGSVCVAAAFFAVALVWPSRELRADESDRPVDASTLRGKVLCGYQGWFRCAGDASGLGWIHWSRDARRITPKTVSFEMWPDLAEYGPAERFAAPGFLYPGGRPAELFSSDNRATVLRHFRWMQSYGIDGVWPQHFVVDLPGSPGQNRYASRLRVLEHVRAAAAKTGRVWALAFDIAGMPPDHIFDVLTRNWRALVDAGITSDARYLHEKQLPVVQVWGFYHHTPSNSMSGRPGQSADRFFARVRSLSGLCRGRRRLELAAKSRSGLAKNAAAVGRIQPLERGQLSHRSRRCKTCVDQLLDRRPPRMRAPRHALASGRLSRIQLEEFAAARPGLVTIPRRRGEFLWEQFRELARLKVTEATVAMFDEVDEGTAIFKVTSSPPIQAEFVGLEGLPSDWYLRLTGEGTKMLAGRRAVSERIPIRQ